MGTRTEDCKNREELGRVDLHWLVRMLGCRHVTGAWGVSRRTKARLGVASGLKY
jgi:hypothetical protein